MLEMARDTAKVTIALITKRKWHMFFSDEIKIIDFG